VTWTTHPEGAGDQIFPCKELLESFFPMKVFGNEVMPGKPADGALAKFAVRGLGWKF
jgi:hypothetical protein